MWLWPRFLSSKSLFEAKPKKSAAQLRSLIIPTCELPMPRRRRIDRGSAYRSFPASGTNRRASLSLPQVAMPRTRESSALIIKRYPENEALKFWDQKYTVYHQFVFKSSISLLGETFEKTKQIILEYHWSWFHWRLRPWIRAHWSRGSRTASKRGRELKLLWFMHLFFTQHPTLNSNKGILQLRVSCSGFQHVRMMRDEVSKYHVSPEITVLK